MLPLLILAIPLQVAAQSGSDSTNAETGDTTVVNGDQQTTVTDTGADDGTAGSDTPGPQAVIDTVQIGFLASEVSLKRSAKGVLHKLSLDGAGLEDGLSYPVKIKVGTGTTLAGSEFELDVPFTTWSAADGASKHFYLTILPDSVEDRERKIELLVEVEQPDGGGPLHNKGPHTMMVVRVGSAGPALQGYNYLAYVGTNFDLVDGVQAQNLFFATNIFLPRNDKLKTGHFVSLYGNRAFTTIDSAGIVSRVTGRAPTSDSTYEAYFADAERVTQYTSDNIGAYYTPLIRIGKERRTKPDLVCYFSPAAEFIWRRVSRSTTYSNLVPTDTASYTGSIPASLSYPNDYLEQENRFEFKVGPGVFLAHDNDKISVHLYANTGFSTLYIPQGRAQGVAGEYDYSRQFDVYFAGRLWITEPQSGITLQAEVVNSLEHPQPYYVVTLSKAIQFKGLGGLFAPVTAR